MRFLNKCLNDISLKNIFVIYIFFAIFITTLSVIYCYLTINKFEIVDNNLEIIFKNLQFDYGNLTHNMYYNNSFSQIKYGVLLYLYKFPLLAFILVGLAKISKNIFFIFIMKNFFTYSLYFFSTYLSLKSLNKTFLVFIIILFIPFINTYTIHNGLNIFYEDNLITLFLPSLFLLIISEWSKKYLLCSVLIFLLYLTKSSMFYLSLLFPFLVFILEENKISFKIIPFYGLILAIMIWGSFGYLKTDRFPFGTSQLSGNSFALSSVILNKNFLNFYPSKSVDLIPQDQSASKHFDDEWEFYDYYKEKNKIFLNENFSYYLSTIPVKLKFIFFNVYKDSTFPDSKGNYKNEFMISYLINKFFFNFGILILLITFVKNFKSLNSIKKILHFKLEIYYLFFLAINLFPHVAAWATAKHLVPIQLISLIYLILKLSEKLDNKMYIKD